MDFFLRKETIYKNNNSETLIFLLYSLTAQQGFYFFMIEDQNGQ